MMTERLWGKWMDTAKIQMTELHLLSVELRWIDGYGKDTND
jgi:hypothetical protein